MWSEQGPVLPIWIAVASILVGSSVRAAEAANPDKSLDAVRTAADPSNGPPIADAVVPTRHSFQELGPPGPYYPERAVRTGVIGVAVIQCKLAQLGALSDCTVLAEAPSGYGFGMAMLKMANAGYLKAQPPSGFTPDTPARIIMAFPKPKF